jgi:hypothetical protein
VTASAFVLQAALMLLLMMLLLLLTGAKHLVLIQLKCYNTNHGTLLLLLLLLLLNMLLLLLLLLLLLSNMLTLLQQLMLLFLTCAKHFALMQKFVPVQPTYLCGNSSRSQRSSNNNMSYTSHRCGMWHILLSAVLLITSKSHTHYANTSSTVNQAVW